MKDSEERVLCAGVRIDKFLRQVQTGIFSAVPVSFQITLSNNCNNYY